MCQWDLAALVFRISAKGIDEACLPSGEDLVYQLDGKLVVVLFIHHDRGRLRIFEALSSA